MGSGHSEVFGPDYLVSEDVILVTFNYRLGVLGKNEQDEPNKKTSNLFLNISANRHSFRLPQFANT